MKWVTWGLVSSRLGRREITGGWLGSILFSGRGRVISSWCKDEIVEGDLVRGGDGLILLPDGRDGRQLCLLLTLSVEPSLVSTREPSLRTLLRWRHTSTLTKDTRVLNTSATRFEIPSHMSEKEEQSEAWAVWRSLLRGGSLWGWIRYNAGLCRTN